MSTEPIWHGKPTSLCSASDSSPPRTLPIGETYGFLIVSVNADGSETFEGLICGHHSDETNPFTWEATQAAERCISQGFDDGTTKKGEIFRAYEIASITLTGRRLLEDQDPLIKSKRRKSRRQVDQKTTEAPMLAIAAAS